MDAESSTARIVATVLTPKNLSKDWKKYYIKFPIKPLLK